MNVHSLNWCRLHDDEGRIFRTGPVGEPVVRCRGYVLHWDRIAKRQVCCIDLASNNDLLALLNADAIEIEYGLDAEIPHDLCITCNTPNGFTSFFSDVQYDGQPNGTFVFEKAFAKRDASDGSSRVSDLYIVVRWASDDECARYNAAHP